MSENENLPTPDELMNPQSKVIKKELPSVEEKKPGIEEELPEDLAENKKEEGQ
ncbi:MAG: hypothetical protein UT28_C0001G0552 [Berkelbacteria bacterium GW2011_GWE1_39_12]|uniref:Uncharacterized protein n=1 Tax=Berkelbacteria bacterium GW2011_GWE1_39_12 TaxID=1618337 RepID=A0A0G4B331_9BACT|nr:MAG: hypothetical protein UT28_C0001G0552 [Berkelbacteria bacterium GW2011_GWE1_39_12]